MPRPILDFFLSHHSSKEEDRLLRFWLRRIFLVAGVILLLYAAIAFTLHFSAEIYVFLGFYLAVFAALFLLLEKGHIKLASLSLCASGLCGLIYAAYSFGGVRSVSYSALIVVICISGMFLRGKITAVITVISILAGLFLLSGEING